MPQFSPYQEDLVRFQRGVQGLIDHRPDSQQHNFGEAHQPIRKAVRSYETPERREEREAEEKFKAGALGVYDYIRALRPGQKRTVEGKTYLSTIDGPQVLGDHRIADLNLARQPYRNQSIIDEYEKQFRNSPDAVEPVSVSRGLNPQDKLHLSDGNHRVEGAKAAGLDFIKGWSPMDNPQRLKRVGTVVRKAGGPPKSPPGKLAAAVTRATTPVPPPTINVVEPDPEEGYAPDPRFADRQHREKYTPPQHTDTSQPFPAKTTTDPTSFVKRYDNSLVPSLDELRELFNKHPDAPKPVSSSSLKRSLSTGQKTLSPEEKRTNRAVWSTANSLYKAMRGDSPSLESWIKTQGKKLGPEDADALRLATFVMTGLDEATHHMGEHADESGKNWYKGQLAQYIDGIRHVAEKKWGYDPEVFGRPGDPTLTPNMKMYLALTSALSNGKNPTDNALAAYRIFDLARSANPENPWQALPLKNPTAKSGAWSTRQPETERALRYLQNLSLPRNGEDTTQAIRRATDFLTDEHAPEHIQDVKNFLHGRPVSLALPTEGHAYPGSYILGPKLGPFYQNLIGNDRHLTADVWWSRTWGRIVGGLFHGYDKKAGKPFLKAEPSSPRQRELMDRSAEVAAKHLGMSVADFQAVLWYYEKELYEHLGQKKSTTSYVEGINRVLREADPESTLGLKAAHEASTAARQVGSDAFSRTRSRGNKSSRVQPVVKKTRSHPDDVPGRHFEIRSILYPTRLQGFNGRGSRPSSDPFPVLS